VTDPNTLQLKWKFKDVPKSYARLVAWYAPRPIRSEADLLAATERIDVMAGHDLNPDQDDYLDLLSTLVSAYEDIHYPVRTKDMTPREALKCILEESGMKPTELGELLGNRELGPKILRGERELTVNQIAILSEHFAMSPEFFIRKAVRPAKASANGSGRSGQKWRGVARDRVR